MNSAARPLLLLAALLFCPACEQLAPKPPAAAPLLPASPEVALAPLAPSPRLIVGRVLAVDAAQGFAFVDLATDAPRAALIDGTELAVRTLDLRETAHLRASRYLRGRTLGAKIVSGQPSPGDEVVWAAP